ncbi:MAG: 2-amino-4-hydroxy-6-hydroxymethyldihydropteridine diphosphokinase [Acidimicrobiia bacterium]
MTGTRATIALGSNLGNRLTQLRNGLAGLRELGQVEAVSSLYETDPVGGPRQGRYLNAVVLIETDLGPDTLLEGLHRIEGSSDRTRDVHWGPRTLDLDLITYGDRRISEPHLVLPHPRAHERRFVLAPLAEVAPDARLSDGSTPGEAITHTLDQKIERWGGAWPDEAPRMGKEATWWVIGQFGSLTAWLVVVVLTADPVRTLSLGAGALVALGGLALGVGAVSSFGTRITPSPQPREEAGLVDGGVYRLVRHPMYGAVFLSTFGVAVAAGSITGAVVSLVILGFLRLKSGREERILGIVVDGYEHYRARVRHRLIPWIW